MKKTCTLLLLCTLSLSSGLFAQYRQDIAPKVVLEFNVGTPISTFRSVPVQLNASGGTGILIAYTEKPAGGSPSSEFFTLPQGTLSLVMFDLTGKQLWRRELGRNVIPNTNFVPVLPFDLDGDGVEEVWYIDNSDPELPLKTTAFIVQSLDANTGKAMRSFPWPTTTKSQPMGNLFRNFLLGTYAGGKPILVTGQGTYQYGPMALTGYDSNLKRIWRTDIPVGAPGPRGSHMSAIADMDMDGDDDILWGERCIRARDGKILFMPEGYTGHSDIVQPVMDWENKRWNLYCCRENGETPRLVYMDNQGKTIWSDLEGHVDKGWVARFTENGEWICTALEIGRKYKEGREVIRENQKEFAYQLATGEPIELPFKGATSAKPIDFNGDGIHELYYKNQIRDVRGNQSRINGSVSHVSHFMDYPGEQIITHTSDGTIRVWANAEGGPDSPQATRRYEHPFYKRNQKLTAVSANDDNLSGL